VNLIPLGIGAIKKRHCRAMTTAEDGDSFHKNPVYVRLMLEVVASTVETTQMAQYLRGLLGDCDDVEIVGNLMLGESLPHRSLLMALLFEVPMRPATRLSCLDGRP